MTCDLGELESVLLLKTVRTHTVLQARNGHCADEPQPEAGDVWLKLGKLSERRRSSS